MSETTDARQLERAARCFDATGRLQRWPSKRNDQLTILWVVWSFLPDDTQMSEAEVSGMLRSWHDYEDFALLRRELCDLGLLRRTPDGRLYRKIAHDMPEEAAALAARFG